MDRLDRIIRNGWKCSELKQVSPFSDVHTLIHMTVCKVLGMMKTHRIGWIIIWKDILTLFGNRRTQPITLSLAHARRVMTDHNILGPFKQSRIYDEQVPPWWWMYLWHFILSLTSWKTSPEYGERPPSDNAIPSFTAGRKALHIWQMSKTCKLSCARPCWHGRQAATCWTVTWCVSSRDQSCQSGGD